jgi:hypothetical protein
VADVLKRVAGPVALGATAATVYTVPASTTATLRCVHVANEAAADHTFTLSIGTDGAGKRLFRDYPVVAKGVVDWTGPMVLAAGEVLQASADAGAVLTLTVSAVETS